MKLKELLETSPQTLAQKQKEALKEHTINILRDVAMKIQGDSYDAVFDMLTESPAGDGHGCDNFFIDFSIDESLKGSTHAFDINDIITMLKELHLLTIKS